MRYFKYCHSDVVERVAAGSFRFGSWAWYRQIEERTSDAVIGDRMEGREVGRLDQASFSDDRTTEEDAALRARGIQIDGPGTVVLSGATFIQDCGHLLVLCLSLSEDLELPDAGYDACVEVTDIDAFVNCLLETGTVNGRPSCEIFSTVEHGKVAYIAREVELARNLQSLGASPFRKAERYASQKEYRIVLRPHDEWLSDIQYIAIQPREGLLAIVARSEAAPQQSSFDHSKQTVLASLTALVSEIEIFEQRSRQDAAQQRLTYFLVEMFDMRLRPNHVNCGKTNSRRRLDRESQTFTGMRGR